MDLNSQKGFSLIEVVVSIALLAIVGAGIFGGLGTSSKALIITDERETAKNIAEMQLEYIKDLPYSPSYQPRNIDTLYPGFSIVTDQDGEIVAQPVPDRVDGNIQKIEVIVEHGSKRILTEVGYKVR